MKYAILFQTVFDSSSDDEYSDDELDSDNEDSVTDGSTSESSDSSSDDEFEDILNAIHGTYVNLLASRYTKARINNPRSREFIFEYFKDLTPEDFRCMTRLSRDTCNYVLELISADPIFQNCSSCPRAPVHWQLACALDRLGNDGQGVGAARSKFIWGLGYGTVYDHYRRVVHAICNLRHRFLRWPDGRERQQFSLQMESKGFKGVVAFVDGTTFPLHVKPSYHGNEYLDRKKRYSINAQVVYDPNHKIRHFMSRMPGSCHDSRIFLHSPLVSNPQSYFSPRQYILADSAYATSEFLVPAYRSRSRDNVVDDTKPGLIETFNTYLAQAKVVNEHTIGILKSRWTSLRCLRLGLREHGDIANVIKHTICCVILHNIALDKDPWEEELMILDEDVDADDGMEAQARAIGGQTPGQRKRLEVTSLQLDWWLWSYGIKSIQASSFHHTCSDNLLLTCWVLSHASNGALAKSIISKDVVRSIGRWIDYQLMISLCICLLGALSDLYQPLPSLSEWEVAKSDLHINALNNLGFYTMPTSYVR